MSMSQRRRSRSASSSGAGARSPGPPQDAPPSSSGVAVVVLGDVGRSPRMQYHCASLAAAAGCAPVTLVGLAGEACMPCVAGDARVAQRLLSPPRCLASAPRLLWPVLAPLRAAWQAAALLLALWALSPPPRVILVQTPPAIPTLAAAACAARGACCCGRRPRARLVVDWHNMGFTVLGLGLRARYGPRGLACAAPLLRLAAAYERRVAALADGHLCVTNAMRLWLWKHWRVA